MMTKLEDSILAKINEQWKKSEEFFANFRRENAAIYIKTPLSQKPLAKIPLLCRLNNHNDFRFKSHFGVGSSNTTVCMRCGVVRSTWGGNWIGEDPSISNRTQIFVDGYIDPNKEFDSLKETGEQ